MGTERFRSRIHLFARPSFLTGVARVIDFGGVLSSYNVSPSNREADYYAFLSDWLSVGDDLEFALEQYEETTHEATP